VEEWQAARPMEESSTHVTGHSFMRSAIIVRAGDVNGLSDWQIGTRIAKGNRPKSRGFSGLLPLPGLTESLESQ
jgi:hypothetical protein